MRNLRMWNIIILQEPPGQQEWLRRWQTIHRRKTGMEKRVTILMRSTLSRCMPGKNSPGAIVSHGKLRH